MHGSEINVELYLFRPHSTSGVPISKASVYFHVIAQCFVTERVPIKLQLTGKSRLIFELTPQTLWLFTRAA